MSKLMFVASNTTVDASSKPKHSKLRVARNTCELRVAVQVHVRVAVAVAIFIFEIVIVKLSLPSRRIGLVLQLVDELDDSTL
jgi:hypothetical protein